MTVALPGSGENGLHAAAARSIATNGAISSAGATISRPARSIARFGLVVGVVVIGISNSPFAADSKIACRADNDISPMRPRFAPSERRGDNDDAPECWGLCRSGHRREGESGGEVKSQ